MNKETKTKIEEQLLDIFFKMDRNESDRHTIESIASIYCQSNLVPKEVKAEVSKALLKMFKEGLLETVPFDQSKPVSLQFSFRLNDELRKQSMDMRKSRGTCHTQGSRRITSEFPFSQNLEYLCSMEDNLFRFC